MKTNWLQKIELWLYVLLSLLSQEFGNFYYGLAKGVCLFNSILQFYYTRYLRLNSNAIHFQNISGVIITLIVQKIIFWLYMCVVLPITYF